MAAEVNPKKPMFQLSIDTKMLAERLQKTSVGDTVTYEECSKIVSRDVTNGARHVLQAARRYCEAHYNMLFGCVHRVGLKRLNDSEIVDLGESTLKHVRRTSLKTARRIAQCADYEKLSEQKKIKHNTYASVLAMLGTALTEKRIAKIEERVKDTQRALPLAQTLKAITE